MSRRREAASLTLERVTVSPFILLTLLSAVNFLVITTSPSSGIISRFSSFFLVSSFTEKTSSTKPESLPALTRFLPAFAPKAKLIEPIITDFPAPVSPVRMFNPSPKETSASSIIMRFLT